MYFNQKAFTKNGAVPMGKGKQLFPLGTNPGRYPSRMSERGKPI